MPVEEHPETLRRVQRPRDERGIVASIQVSISSAGCLPPRVCHRGPLKLDSVHPLSPEEARLAPTGGPRPSLRAESVSVTIASA
jgi:hypothetical protein